MTLVHLDSSLAEELRVLQQEGRAKGRERVIAGYLPPTAERGPRYLLEGHNQEFLRLNSNSYLSLSHHPQLIAAAEKASHDFGVGPGAVRFIDGTFSHHRQLEETIASFVAKPAAKIFNSAYTANCGLALALGNSATHWIGDQLNHNSIIRAMRIAGVPRSNKSIYAHNDLDALRNCLEQVDSAIQRVVVIFDGIFSMRGDSAPLGEIQQIAESYSHKFADGVITVVDDSHGVGAYGAHGRGTPDYCGVLPDIIVGTFGKAFGVNGGFIAASPTVVEAVRQKADTYIYTNPLSVGDCAAATRAIELCDEDEGQRLLGVLSERTAQFRAGLHRLGKESIPGPHPIIPLLVRDTQKTHKLVHYLFEHNILVVGLTFPVVPQGDETIRFQINAAHSESDIELVLRILEQWE